MPMLSKARTMLEAMRPGQWVKNALVAAPLFFAWGDPGQGLGVRAALAAAAAKAIAATLAFCAVSSGIYLFNDIRDKDDDARHPVKRFRPIASGALPVGSAAALAALLLAGGLAAAFAVAPVFGAVASAYAAMQIIYTLALKRVVLLDVIVIAVGFVMRAVGGAVAIGVAISPWLVLCTFFLSLFLALCKRRQEKVTRDENEQRRSLKAYSVALLDILIAISSTLAIASYALYAVSAETVAKFGTPRLAYTVPFVVFGVFRYVHLVFVESQGEHPERTLLTDGTILATVFLYLAAFAVILATR